jgi:hypothetical protein
MGQNYTGESVVTRSDTVKNACPRGDLNTDDPRVDQ